MELLFFTNKILSAASVVLAIFFFFVMTHGSNRYFHKLGMSHEIMEARRDARIGFILTIIFVITAVLGFYNILAQIILFVTAIYIVYIAVTGIVNTFKIVALNK